MTRSAGALFCRPGCAQDDGHTLVGVDAIKAFLAEASAKYSATSVPSAIERQGKHHVVRAIVSGNFPAVRFC